MRGDGMSALDLMDIIAMSRGRAVFDAPCPFCGPYRISPANRTRRVFRAWLLETTFATYCCARCGEKGFVHATHARPPDPAKLAKAKAEADEHDRRAALEQHRKALWLWRKRQPIVSDNPAWRYLREARRYKGTIPPTLGYLPAHGNYPSALIAAFGIATEPEPGVLHIDDADVKGVHVTRLLPDGSGRVDAHDAKIMIGRSAGWPIVLAPPNDGLGLLISEGIEDALSGHEATGLGAWAAGSASRLPALAEAVPSYIEAATVLVDDDPAGQRHAGELARALVARGIVEVRRIVFDSAEAVA